MIKSIFIAGAIPPSLIAESITKHSSKTDIGGHSIFLGQVRADSVDQHTVQAIEYTSNRSMALQQANVLREEIITKYKLCCMHIYHSLGTVKAGELCLFVFTSSAHRQAAIDACEEAVERIKRELPIWGKELFEDHSHQWKVNT